MSKLIESRPVLQIETIPIERAIREERMRLQDIEWETDQRPSDWLLKYMEAEADRGIRDWVINL